MSKVKIQLQCRDADKDLERFLLKKTVSLIEKHGLQLSWEMPDCLISIGGDGTTIANYMKFGVPILPVRNQSLGYISDIGIDQLDEALGKLAIGEYYVENRIMLDVSGDGFFIASVINDATFMQAPKRVGDIFLYDAMRFNVLANGKPLFDYEHLMGDGVTFATPTGSTGYNRSAGGYMLPKRQPLTTNKIIVTLRYPIGLERRKERSKILDAETVLTFKFYRPDTGFLITDSRCQEVESQRNFFVEKSRKTFQLVRIKGMTEEKSAKEKRRKTWLKSQTKPHGY